MSTPPSSVAGSARCARSGGISLSALARLAGVGKATLSGLENGTRNPTLETLYAITAQLGVPLTAVLAEPADEPTVRGAAVSATLLEVFNDTDATYELYRMRVAPGPGQLSPAHQAGVTEHVTVFAGVLRAGPADAPLTAGRRSPPLGVRRAAHLRGGG